MAYSVDDGNMKGICLEEVRYSLDRDLWHAVTHRVGRSSHDVADNVAQCTVY